MTGLLKKPLFWTNVAALIFVGWIVAGLAFGWTNPTASPPGGSGAVSVDSLGNVGIGAIVSGQKLNVAGNIALNGVPINTPGTINSASNPLEWTKLKNVPAGFADGVDDAGGSPDWNLITNKPPGFADDIDDTSSCSFVSTSGSQAIGVPTQCNGKACLAMWRNSTGTLAGSARIIQWPGTNFVSSHTLNSDSGVGEGKYREYIGTNGNSTATTLMSYYGSTQSFTILTDDLSGSETSASQWWVVTSAAGTFAFCN